MRLALFLLAFATPAFAQDGLHATDELLDRAAMEEQLAGQIIEFYDGSKSRYDADGRYGYTYTDEGPVWSGRYRLMGQSEVCVDFDNGSVRCDLIVRNGERLVLVTTEGIRFPVRNQSVAPN